MSAAPQVHVLIPAAGRGIRFGGTLLKQYLPVGGKPVLAHTISAFQFHPMISSITVILAEDDQWFESAVGLLSANVNTVTGGQTRAQSVRNGLRYLSENYSDSDWALVHDAARPCLSTSRLEKFLEQGLEELTTDLISSRIRSPSFVGGGRSMSASSTDMMS